MDSPKVQEFLGVDVGSVRVGLARGNSAARLAEPLKTVPADKALDELKKLASENSAAGIVVGLPRGLDGSETAQTDFVRNWVNTVKPTIGLPFYWQDEALTSRQAEESKDSSAGTDAAAAAIILQDFLDGRENDRVTA